MPAGIVQGPDLGPDDYRFILENCYDEIMLIDAAGVVLYVNSACERNYGLQPSDIIGKKVFDLGAEGYYKPVVAPLVFDKKETITIEQETVQGVKLAVTFRPILDEAGNVKYIVTDSRDISQIAKLKNDLEKTLKMMREYQLESEKLKRKQTVRKDMIANSAGMRQALELAHKVAASDATIIILGESGTGKNVMANQIHKMSRRAGPFLNINCAAIPEHLIESELFGYRRGAFTGASQDKVGLIELADEGTILLDEVAEIPITLQAKILEFVQQKQFIPIGGRAYKKVNCRIIAATNRNLMQLVEEGAFRRDLYYRLNVVSIPIPPLREREKDIHPFTILFLNKFNSQYKKYCSISSDCMKVLKAYSWPGNVRELENLIEFLVLTSQKEEICIEDLPEHIPGSSKGEAAGPAVSFFDEAVDRYIREIVTETYKEHNSSYRLARALNITQPRAYRMIQKYIIGMDT